MDAAPPFVPAGFEAPPGLATPEFVLEPLGPQHNTADYAAWSSSMAHIQATPGFVGGSWPHEMSLEQNLEDLRMHARDFERRTGFTYTVLDPERGDVIGCVYIYPVTVSSGDNAEADADAAGRKYDASVRSWVRGDRAALDEPLWRAVNGWLAVAWPFSNVRYAARS